MFHISRLFSNHAQHANQQLAAASRNNAVKDNDLAIKTEVYALVSKYDTIESGYRAVIDERLTAHYLTTLPIDSENRILERYSKEIATHASYGPDDHHSIDGVIKSLNNALANAHQGSRINSDKIVKELINLSKTLNNSEKFLQKMREAVDQEIEKEVGKANILLSSIKDNIEILNSNSKNKTGIEYVNAQEILWQKVADLAKYFTINKVADQDNNIIIHIVSNKEIHPLISKSHASELIYRKLDNTQFNSIIMNRFVPNSKVKRTIDELTVASGEGKGNSVNDKIQGGIIGGLLKVRDGMIPEAISQYNDVAQSLLNEFNKLHNRFNPPAGASALTASKILDSNTIIDSQEKLVIALVSIKEEENVPPMEIKFNSQTTIEDVINKINEHFQGNLKAELTSGGTFKLTAHEKYKIALRSDNDEAKFANFVGLNDLFQNISNNLRTSQNSAKDIMVREDIVKDPSLFSYLSLNKNDQDKYSIEQNLSIPFARKFQEFSTQISADIISHFYEQSQTIKNSANDSNNRIKDLKEALTSCQGIGDDDIAKQMDKIIFERSNFAVCYKAAKDLHELLIKILI